MPPDSSDPSAAISGTSDHLPGASTPTVNGCNPAGSSTLATVSPSTFTFRRAIEADAGGIVRIGRKVWRETFRHTTTPENVKAYLDSTYTLELITTNINDPTRRIVVVASHDGEVAGFAVLVTDSSPSEPSIADWPSPIELQKIYIDTPYHGAGLAKLLTDGTYDLARSEGYQSIWLGVLPINTRAVRFYEKSGFVKVGEHGFWVGDQLDTDDIMIRRL